MSDDFSGGPRRERSDRGDRGDRGERSGGGFGGGFRGRRKSCPFSAKGAPKIDYKDIRLLQRFVSERGKMMPSRITAVAAKHQRTLTQAIKRARFLALLPYADKKSGS
jgi:small subunit ribosomal protein S18